MNATTPQDTLSFEKLLAGVCSFVKKDDGFPLSSHAARCSNCSYFRRGKCSLAYCCCMNERVKAHSCSYADILSNCFSRIKDNVFYYRLRIVADRVALNRTVFLDFEHRKRFTEGLALIRNDSPSKVAQVYLLSANSNLWERVKMCIGHNSLELLKISSVTDKKERNLLILADRYIFGARVWYFEDITDDELTDFDTFFLICNSVLLSVYGEDVIQIAERHKKRKRKKKQYRGGEHG